MRATVLSAPTSVASDFTGAAPDPRKGRGSDHPVSSPHPTALPGDHTGTRGVPHRVSGPTRPPLGASGRRGFWLPDFREAWLLGSCALRSSWNPPCGHLAGQGSVGARSTGGPLDTESSTVPPRNPAVPLQRGDGDTRGEETCPRSPSFQAGGIPGALGELGVGTQAPPSWKGGSSPQINCCKSDTEGIHVGREALRWGHRVCVCVRRVRVTSGRGW